MYLNFHSFLNTLPSYDSYSGFIHLFLVSFVLFSFHRI